MADRPEQLPRWATEDQTDDVSGQQNVVEPPSERKESGWDRREIPPRQWQNWLARLYYRWIEWARDKIDNLEPRVDDNEAELDAATSNETPDTIAKRDADGRMRAEDPEADQDVATKKWTEDQLSGTDDLPVFFIRAFAAFDASDYDGSGIIQTVHATGNIDSTTIERTGTGQYTLFFEQNMPDENYAVLATCSGNTFGEADGNDHVIGVVEKSTDRIKISTTDPGSDQNLLDDSSLIAIQVVR